MSKTKTDNQTEEKNAPLNKNKAARLRLKKKKNIRWVIKITLIGLIISITFNFLSQIATTGANIAVALLILALLLFINICSDMIAIATTACELPPLLAMGARKEKGAKTAIWLVKNAEKVSSVFADVVGDIVGLLSGAFVVIIALRLFKDGNRLIVANMILSALLGAFIISGKAILKIYALNHPQKIVLQFSKIIEIFKRQK